MAIHILMAPPAALTYNCSFISIYILKFKKKKKVHRLPDFIKQFNGENVVFSQKLNPKTVFWTNVGQIVLIYF